MLAVSLAAHIFLGVLAFVRFSSGPVDAPVPVALPAPQLLYIAPQRLPDAMPVPRSRPGASSIAISNPASLPLLPQVKTTRPATAPGSADLAFESKARPQLRDTSWESALAPAQAPHLDGKGGIVFVLDVSGSMYEPLAGTTRLALARQTLARYLRAVPEGTPFAVVVYAVTARLSGPLVAASPTTREAAVRFIAQDFDCGGGGTNLPGGLACAGTLGPGRLLVVTDGDLNAPRSDLLADAGKVLGPAGRAPALTLLGIRPRAGTVATQVLQELADQERGTYLPDPDARAVVQFNAFAPAETRR